MYGEQDGEAMSLLLMDYRSTNVPIRQKFLDPDSFKEIMVRERKNCEDRSWRDFVLSAQRLLDLA